MQNVYDASCVSSRRTFEARAEKLSAYSPGQEFGRGGGSGWRAALGSGLPLTRAGDGTAPCEPLESAGEGPGTAAGVLAVGALAAARAAAGWATADGATGGAASTEPGSSAARAKLASSGQLGEQPRPK